MAKKEKNTKETAKKNKQPPKKNIKKTPKKERLFEDDMMIDVVGRFKDTLKLMEKQEKKAPPKKEKASPKREKSQPAKPGKKPAEKAKNSQKQSKKASPAAQPKQPLPKIKRAPVGKLKIISLGGLNEIGKNLTVFEYENDMIIVDCGLGFPDDDMPGVDLVIPDFSYLEENREKIRGVLLTHGHEDHIGAIPYLLRVLNPPIFGTNLTLGIIKNKLLEHQLPNEPKLQRVNAGDKIRLGAFDIEFIHVNHSIADACALAIETPLGTVIHTGDFKLDVTPIDGEMMNITRLGEIGNEGVLALLCESTNAERPGYTPSEKKVGRSLDYIFNTNEDKRIVIATFSSNVHRVQQIIDTSVRYGRKVAITGRSMINIVGAAVELGYMSVPENVLVDIAEIRRFKPEELTLITTGSQGEPMSALYRMAFGEHAQVSLGTSDLVVLSSSAIPGNEKLVGRIINELSKNGVKVLHDSVVEVHVSGHACQEELKLMQALTKPQYFIPIHGEYRHLAANRELALDMGMSPDSIFISDIGKVLEIDAKGARFNGTVQAGNVLVDGYGVGDVGNIVLRDRKHLSQDGLIVIVAAIEHDLGLLVSGPDVVSRGFVYVRESESLMDNMKTKTAEIIENELKRSKVDRIQLKNKVKDDLAKYIYQQTKRKPMIIPIIMDV
ncbi:MAG: RNase J family beta-CASP ribonuclease [Clostridia bacterium]|nr:RNase J family beta-CASP ribonuclease [Clostridia bacterium]